MTMSRKTLPYSLHIDAQVLQGEPWGLFQSALGNKTYTAHGSDWHWLAIARQRRYGSYLDVPYGPTIASKKALKHAIDELTTKGRALGATFVRIEPVGDVTSAQLRALGARPAEKNFQPQHTIIIDVTKPEAQLRAELFKGRKSALTKAVNSGVTLEMSDASEIGDFLDMMHGIYDKKRIQPHPDSYYQQLVDNLHTPGVSRLYYATHGGKRVAAAITLSSPTTEYYLFAASHPEARDVEAASFLVWQIMLSAKERGLTRVDLFGIAPPNQPNHPWSGFTTFKKSFGGEAVERVGTWEIPLKPFKYGLLRAVKRLKKLL